MTTTAFFLLLFQIWYINSIHFEYLEGDTQYNQRGPHIPSSRFGSSLFVSEDEHEGLDIYMFGGYGFKDVSCESEIGILSDFYIFSYTENLWYKQESIHCNSKNESINSTYPQGAVFANTFTKENGFILGWSEGLDDNLSVVTIDSHWLYDIENNEWKKLSRKIDNSVKERSRGYSFIFNSESYLYGGFRKSFDEGKMVCETYTELLLFDSTKNIYDYTIIETSGVVEPRIGSIIWVSDGVLYQLGGFSVNSDCSVGEEIGSFDYLDLDSLKWETKSFEKKVFYGQPFICHDYSYFYGGVYGSVTEKNMFLINKTKIEDYKPEYPINKRSALTSYYFFNKKRFFFGGFANNYGEVDKNELISLKFDDLEIYDLFNDLYLQECHEEDEDDDEDDIENGDIRTFIAILSSIAGIGVISTFFIFLVSVSFFIGKASGQKGEIDTIDDLESFLLKVGLIKYLKSFRSKNIIVFDLYNLAAVNQLHELIPDEMDRNHLIEYTKNNPILSYSISMNKTLVARAEEELKEIAVPIQKIQRERAISMTGLPDGSEIVKTDHDFCPIYSGEFDKNLLTWGKIINRGAYGTIKLAYIQINEKLYFPVAVKMMLEAERKEVEKEVMVMTKVKHQYILKTFGCWYEDKGRKAFIVEEYCPDGDLYKYKHRMTIKQKIEVLIKTCEGMIELNKHGLTHRDLKPQNILIKKRPNGVIDVKICDFGSSGLRSTISKSLVGTPEYLAPEQVNSKRIPSYEQHLIDIYSFGIILWEVFTCQNPYSKLKKMSAKNVFKFIKMIHEEQLRPDIGELNELIHEKKELINLMIKCWDENPKNRPNSFTEIKIELEKVMKNIEKEEEEEKLVLKI